MCKLSHTWKNFAGPHFDLKRDTNRYQRRARCQLLVRQVLGDLLHLRVSFATTRCGIACLATETPTTAGIRRIDKRLVADTVCTLTPGGWSSP